MWGNNESLHHGVSHKPGRSNFWKYKSDHKKKYEAQEKVGRGRKNEVHVDETRNWRTNHKNIYTIYEMWVDIASLKNLDKKNRQLKRTLFN